MSEAAETDIQSDTQDTLQRFSDILENGSLAQLHGMLRSMHTAEIAYVLESLPAELRKTVFSLVRPNMDGDLLLHLNDNLRASLINEMAPQELVAAAEGLDTDDLADLLPEMPDDVTEQILQSLDEQNRRSVEHIMSYKEDTAGGLMNTDTIQVRADITIDVVLRYLRLRGNLPEATDSLMVVDRSGIYLGTLGLASLLTSDTSLQVSETMTQNIDGILASTSVQEVAKLFEHRDLISAPVVDETGILLGRITIDDVVDVIRDEADHSFMSMAGLNEEEDLFAPVFASSKRRTIWLGINMLTAILASWVIGMFDATIEKLVALAILMPIVASMGGIAGNQTLALVIRGMALGQISNKNAHRLIIKEVSVGLLNGLVWAVIIGLISMYWFDSMMLGVVLAAAMFVNLIVAALSGAGVPILLKKLGIDPAIAGSVVLTTVTDIIGFVAFLGLASLLLF
ncbi:MAG: magnesium transporter [Gammaproteobacteria bacterium]|nr:magnesium transporter [Gammaproteobacteria bacterium]